MFCGLFLNGCNRDETKTVVLYTSIDQPIAAPIIAEFEKQTGIKVTLVTDTEATKSVGLTERLRAEKSNPQADVWWGNEPFNTINLADEGVLAPYTSSATDAARFSVPAQFCDDQRRWFCNGLRARVLICGKSKQLTHLQHLTDPSLKGRLAMARPTAGTTGGHVAALFVAWGDDKATKFFQSLHDNQIKLVGGNSIVADSVAGGTLDAGLCDNDDAASAENGKCYWTLPDQDGAGTLAIPTTVSLVRGAPHFAAAGKLIDYLSSVAVEKRLIDAKFAGWSVRSYAPALVQMKVDYVAAARKMPEAIRKSTEILEGR